MALIKAVVATIVALGIPQTPVEAVFQVKVPEDVLELDLDEPRSVSSDYIVYKNNIEIINKKGEEAVKKRRAEAVKRKQIQAKRDKSKQTVFLTNFYPGDSLNTVEKTSSGHMMKDFGTNKYGMKTYNGRVVIGAATNLCLQVKTGACAKYNSLPKGFKTYDIGDKLEINFKGEWLPAVVLSSCGACFWDREYQTVDVLIDKNKGRFGKIIGETR